MRPMVLALLAMVVFGGCNASGISSSAGLPSPMTSSPMTLAPSNRPSATFPATFASPVYGYTMGLAADWTVKPAALPADDPASTDVTGTDVVTVTGTDTTIQTVVSDLGGQAFEAWLTDYWTAMASAVPQGCDGGDPSTWPAVTVGDRQGVWQQKCNAAVAIVEDGGKAYQFAWENSTFKDPQHLPDADFKAVLGTVRFPQPSASTSPAPK